MAIDWMKHPLNAREQQNVAKMMMKNGMAGYGAFWALNELLMNEEAHQVEPDYNVLGYRLHCDAGLIKSVASEFGLYVFTEDGEYMHSELVDNQAEQIGETSSKRSAAGKQGAKKRWQTDSKAMASAKQVHGKAIASDSRLDKTKTRQDNKDLNHSPASAEPHVDFDKLFEYLNEKSGKHFKNTATNRKLVHERLREGFTPKDLQTAIDNVTAGWLGTDMEQYIRPSTIFRASKFEGYVNSVPRVAKPQQSGSKPQRHEATPEWMQAGYQTPKQEVTEADKAELATQLAELDKLKQEHDA